jgi:predicted phage baseplate assembly protein
VVAGRAGLASLVGQEPHVDQAPLLDLADNPLEGDGFRVWSEVDDFSLSGPDDTHYVLNCGTGEVLFGDGRHGKVPAGGANNVKAAPYRYGGGTRGNVGAGTITQLRSSHVYIDSVTNPEAAVGGGDEETVEDAMARGPTEQLKTRNRAVAAEDFETLTLESSTGLARAKTLPLHDPAHSEDETPGVVSVIAMPRGGGTLSQALRDAIRAHLDERRLVTTRIYVIDPNYVTVDVHATVAKTPEADADVLTARAEGTLAEFLDPEYGGDPAKAAAYVQARSSGTPAGERGTGWPFGRSIYLSELYEVIERVRGVDHVESISTPTGAVPLEQDQLPVSGTHVIQVV